MEKPKPGKKALVLDFEGIEVTSDLPASTFSEADIKQIAAKIRQGSLKGRGGQPVGKKSVLHRLADGTRVNLEYTDSRSATIKPAKHGG